MGKKVALLISSVLVATAGLANAADLGKFGNWTVSQDETTKLCSMVARADDAHSVTIIRGKEAPVPYKHEGKMISRIVIEGIINKQWIGKFDQTIRIINEKGRETYSNTFSMEKGDNRASANLSIWSAMGLVKLGNDAGVQRIKAPWNSFDVDFNGYKDAEMKLSDCSNGKV
jgi:hypothetical protein